jgi:predicted nucleotidyltransferase
MDEASTIASLSDRIGDIGTERPDLTLAVLFGSQVRGRSRDRSDVDVALLADSVVDLDAAFLALAPRLRSSRLDLVDLRRAGPLLAFEVARHGRVLFERTAGNLPRVPVPGVPPLCRHEEAQGRPAAADSGVRGP